MSVRVQEQEEANLCGSLDVGGVYLVSEGLGLVSPNSARSPHVLHFERSETPHGVKLLERCGVWGEHEVGYDFGGGEGKRDGFLWILDSDDGLVQGFRLGKRCGVVNREAKQEALSGSQVLVPEIRVLDLRTTSNSESER